MNETKKIGIVIGTVLLGLATATLFMTVKTSLKKKQLQRPAEEIPREPNPYR